VDNDPPLTDRDVQAIMVSLFDIRAGFDYLVSVAREEDDDEPEEEEED